MYSPFFKINIKEIDKEEAYVKLLPKLRPVLLGIFEYRFFHPKFL